MFDIAFSELLIIAVVALLVIGPERLPKVARTAGMLFGRLQRYVNDVKADINREMELEELRRLRTEFEDAAQTVQRSLNDVDREVRAAGDELTRSVSEVGAVGEELTRSLSEVRAAGDELTRSVSDGASTGLPPPTDAPAPAPAPSPPKPGSEAKV